MVDNYKEMMFSRHKRLAGRMNYMIDSMHKTRVSSGLIKSQHGIEGGPHGVLPLAEELLAVDNF